MTQYLTHPTTPNPLYTLPNSGVRISSVSSPFSLSRNHTNLSDLFFPKPIPFLQTLTLKKSTAMSFSHHNDDDDDNNNRRRLYNPYQDLQLPAQTLYKLPTSPEFLFQEEAVALRRSWGENLTYYTGIGYLGGAIVGGGKGLIEGLRSSEPGDTTKLRVNRILNAGGHGGRKFGNRAGVIGLLYAGLESGMVAVRDTDDVINSVVAGLGTGALFKAASGPRSAAVAGAIGGVVVGLAVTGKQVLKRYVPI